MLAPHPGLCATCRHAQPVPAARTLFWKCGLAREDARFPRYPPLPVRECAGYQASPDEGEDVDAAGR